tara:strand:- start:14980 stop:15279 length:300 start_codon:yes stop_codon:yes gene_type:complete
MVDVVKSYKAKTFGDNELEAFIKENTSHYMLKWKKGGTVAPHLSGVYTSLTTVDTDVYNYINTEEAKDAIEPVDERVKAKAKTERRLAKQKAKLEGLVT